jgi:hypothetical protein
MAKHSFFLNLIEKNLLEKIHGNFMLKIHKNGARPFLVVISSEYMQTVAKASK